jgi:hypothetical protein
MAWKRKNTARDRWIRLVGSLEALWANSGLFARCRVAFLQLARVSVPRLFFRHVLNDWGGRYVVYSSVNRLPFASGVWIYRKFLFRFSAITLSRFENVIEKGEARIRHVRELTNALTAVASDQQRSTGHDRTRAVQSDTWQVLFGAYEAWRGGYNQGGFSSPHRTHARVLGAPIPPEPIYCRDCRFLEKQTKRQERKWGKDRFAVVDAFSRHYDELSRRNFSSRNRAQVLRDRLPYVDLSESDPLLLGSLTRSAVVGLQLTDFFRDPLESWEEQQEAADRLSPPSLDFLFQASDNDWPDWRPGGVGPLDEWDQTPDEDDFGRSGPWSFLG